MSAIKLSTKHFQKILREELLETAADNGWSFDNNAERGYTFQHWCAVLVSNTERTFDTDPDDAVLYSKDLKADLVFEDTNANHLLICQCKYRGFRTSVAEDDVVSFFDRHHLFMDPEWVREHGSDQAVAALVDYSERVNSGWSVGYYFLSTANASDRVNSLAAKANERFEKQGVRAACSLRSVEWKR